MSFLRMLHLLSCNTPLAAYAYSNLLPPGIPPSDHSGILETASNRYCTANDWRCFCYAYGFAPDFPSCQTPPCPHVSTESAWDAWITSCSGYIASLGTMTPSSGANTSPSATLRTLSSGPRSTSISNIIPPSTTMSTATSSANGAPEAPLQANSSYPSAPHGLAHGSKVGIGVGALFGTVALLALGFFLGRFRFGFKLPALRTRTTSRIVQEEAIPSKQTRQDVVELDGIAQARHELSGSAQVATELPLSPPSPAIGPRRDQVPDAAEVPNNEAGRSDIPSEDQLGKYETLTCNEEERKKN